MTNRLLSYADWLKGGSDRIKTFEFHFARMREKELGNASLD